jgi:hypothetical protein
MAGACDGKHSPPASTSRIAASSASEEQVLASRPRTFGQAAFRHRRQQMIGQHQHAQRLQTQTQFSQYRPARATVGGHPDNQQIGMVNPGFGGVQRGGIEVDQIAGDVRLRQRWCSPRRNKGCGSNKRMVAMTAHFFLARRRQSSLLQRAD